MRIKYGSRVALTCLTIALLIGAAGCGGDGASPLPLTITACDATTYAAFGVVCIDFVASGPGFAQIQLLAQFSAGPGAPLETATPIPPALATQLGVTSTSGPVNPQPKVSFRFCWFAGADLGFVRTSGIQFSLTPVTAAGVGPAAGCPPFDYAGGGQTVLASGPGIGNLMGRAGHCAENVGGKSVAIAGGSGASGGGVAVYDTLDRLTFDTAQFTYTKSSFPLSMQNPRANHACSFFLDPATNAMKVLVTGGDISLPGPSPIASADVYCLTPTEQVTPTMGSMNVARRNHTATWIPSNEVVIIGGADATGSLCSIEVWDPALGTFQVLPAALAFCRHSHTATLLPSGKVLVAGGFDSTTGTALPAELLDVGLGTVMTVPGPLVDRVQHTATRLPNGWVLLAGGFLASNPAMITSSAQIFEPELGSMGEFTTTSPMMISPRALHAASLLGDGHVLLTGGETGAAACPVVTQTAEIFLPETLLFTSTIAMRIARADHSSTATSCGAVAIIGGMNDANCVANFLSSVEIYPFENQTPVIAGASNIPPQGPGGTLPAGATDIYITVTDEDADGGYVIIRFRPAGSTGMFTLARIVGQGSNSPSGFPSMQVMGLPSIGVPHVFRWQFSLDGLTAGQAVEVEVLPVGATLGTPVRFTATLP